MTIDPTTKNAETTFPVKPGDWVVDRSDAGKVAMVKGVYRDTEVLVDLALYDRDGKLIGRASPAIGGPRNFEPAMTYGNWERIDDPRFPIGLRWIPSEKDPNVSVAIHATKGKRLPDREWVKPKRRLRLPAAVVRRGTDYDPVLEASARRMAAQELRSFHKAGNPDLLVKRAEELEREADAISPRR
jgi:hypothetical protein